MTWQKCNVYFYPKKKNAMYIVHTLCHLAQVKLYKYIIIIIIIISKTERKFNYISNWN